LRGLFRIALEQIGQGERGVDFLDDAGDPRDFAFSLRNLLLQRDALLLRPRLGFLAGSGALVVPAVAFARPRVVSTERR
jgi:hypothetical protein